MQLATIADDLGPRGLFQLNERGSLERPSLSAAEAIAWASAVYPFPPSPLIAEDAGDPGGSLPAGAIAARHDRGQ